MTRRGERVPRSTRTSAAGYPGAWSLRQEHSALDDAASELNWTDVGPSQVLERPGCDISYWSRGAEDPARPTVVFLHGAGLDHRMWATQIGPFSRRYRVVTLDLRGHGRSRPATEYSFRSLVDDVFALLDRLSAETAVLVGLSMGGNVAQEVVFQDPARVSALICIDCTCNTLVPWTDRTFLPLYEDAFGPMMALYPTSALIEQIARGSSLREPGRRYIRDASALLSKRELATVMKTLLAALHHEPGYRTPIPQLLVCGSDDRLGNIRKVMPLWNERDARRQLVVIPNASHCANIDNPKFSTRYR
jgi:3-oxoadipate enol-lactonase